MNMINVDFNDLKRTNPDVVGWMKVNGTNINYHFVQANDNKYYPIIIIMIKWLFMLK